LSEVIVEKKVLRKNIKIRRNESYFQTIIMYATVDVVSPFNTHVHTLVVEPRA